MKVQAFILAFALAGSAADAQVLTFAMGSCAELSDPESELIFTHIKAKKPDFFFWLGDKYLLCQRGMERQHSDGGKLEAEACKPPAGSNDAEHQPTRHLGRSRFWAQ